MKNQQSRVGFEVATGAFLGTIVGIPLFSSMTNYGGNFGCSIWIDTLMGMRGYESCGTFGALIGMIIGSLVGVVLAKFVKVKNPRRWSINLLVGAFLLPLIYGVLASWPPTSDIVIVPAITIFFVAITLGLSFLIVSIANLRLWKRK